ncbi:MAG: crossover junction endodeoxyribonuclease RuvC [Ruminococcaceae bacterium]|nr:crossover junction endodeoxyribonuclease RuvC [Oscillospiraceae bacterium]
MIILGIDPGYAIVGVGIIEYQGNHFRPIAYDAITTHASMATSLRLKTIYDDINYCLDRFKPDVVAIEELFFNSNAKTAIAVAQARGVLVVSATNRGIPVYEYTPLQIKQAVAGYGRADKSQVQHMVKSLLNLNAIPKPDDAADALAVAICHAHSSTMNDALGTNRL